MGILDVPFIPRGRGVSRVQAKLETGQNITVAFIGDSGLEGTTAATPGTDDCASVVCSTLATRFGVTVTKSNRAVSGYRAYSPLDPSQANPTKFTQALSDNADLYVIGSLPGHNDINSGASLSSVYLPGRGYAINAAIRAVEHMIRRLRIDRPGADIMVTSGWQYTSTSVGSNTDLVTYQKALRRLAAAYGCAFADYYAALAAVGVTGTNATIDDVYIHPTGDPQAQHPTSAGHAVWAKVITDQLGKGAVVPVESPSLPSPIFGAERYVHTPWVTVPAAAGGVRTAGTSGYRVVGSIAGTATLPITTSTAGDSVEFQFIGHEAVLRFDTGAGQGHIKIEVNGAVYNADLNLSPLGTNQTYLPFDLGPGVHRIVVTLISGSMTFRGYDYAPVLGNRIPYTSGLVTYTGTWAAIGVDSTYFERNAKFTTTLNDTLTIDWIGTALWVDAFRYGNASNLVGVNTDGAGEVVSEWGNNSAGNTSQPGGILATSGLTYGRHSTVIRLASAGRSLTVSTFLAFDETRTDRPRSLRGLTITGESPAFPTPLPGKPLVRLAPADATSAIPGYPSAEATTGFTANGTASAKHVYELDTGRIAY